MLPLEAAAEDGTAVEEDADVPPAAVDLLWIVIWRLPVACEGLAFGALTAAVVGCADAEEAGAAGVDAAPAATFAVAALVAGDPFAATVIVPPFLEAPRADLGKMMTPALAAAACEDVGARELLASLRSDDSPLAEGSSFSAASEESEGGASLLDTEAVWTCAVFASAASALPSSAFWC